MPRCPPPNGQTRYNHGSLKCSKACGFSTNFSSSWRNHRIYFGYMSPQLGFRSLLSEMVGTTYRLGFLLTIKKHNKNDKIIAFKGTNRDFSTISSLHRKPSPTRTLKWPGRNRVQITCNTSSAYHVQHAVLRDTWYEGTAQLLSLTEFKLHIF